MIPVKKDVVNLQKDLKETRKSLKEAEKTITTLHRQVHDLQDKSVVNNQVSKENLKYLINHDRNVRKHNILVMGLKEQSPLIVNETEATTDEDKLALIINYLEVTGSIRVAKMFRLGKQGENPRPLKVMFQDEKIPSQILSKCKNLKNLSDINVYIKPDRTASERKEYDRLSRKKRDLEKEKNTIG